MGPHKTENLLQSREHVAIGQNSCSQTGKWFSLTPQLIEGSHPKHINMEVHVKFRDPCCCQLFGARKLFLQNQDWEWETLKVVVTTTLPKQTNQSKSSADRELLKRVLKIVIKMLKYIDLHNWWVFMWGRRMNNKKSFCYIIIKTIYMQN